MKSCAEEAAGDGHAVDLGGAFVDAHQADLGGEELKREFFCHAHSAVGLHGVVEDFGSHFSGIELDHGGLGADVLAGVLLFGGVHDHEAAGVDLGGGVGDPPLDGLAVGQCGSEGDAGTGLFGEHCEGAAGHADAPGAHLEAADGEAELHGGEAFAGLAKQLRGGNAAVVEDQLVSAVTTDHEDFAFDDEAGGAAFDDKR